MEPTTTRDGAGDVATKPVESLTSRPIANVDESVDLEAEVVFDMNDVSVLYGDFRAVRDATLKIRKNQITAFIGPSGCGKTTILRCLNRMNDFIPTAKVEGSINYHGVDLYDPAVNSTEVRRRIGMVFQKPNPFPRCRSTTTLRTGRAWPACATSRPRGYRRDVTARRHAVGRSQGPSRQARFRIVGRSAATSVHRPCDRCRAGDPAHGRAVLGAGPHLDAGDRAADERTQEHRTRSSS